MSNRQLEEKLEVESDKRIASALGISIDDLYKLDFEISSNESDDGLVYEYIIHFQDSSPKEILEKIEGLSSRNCVYLEPFELEDTSYENELLWDIFSSEQLKNLHANIDSAKKVLLSTLNTNIQFNILVMLHAHIVASIEAFLFSLFIHTVTNSNELIRKVVESDPHFKAIRISMSDVYKKHEKIQLIVGNYLKDMIFHKINKVNELYKSILGVELGDTLWLEEAVITRHDCAHRAGYTKEGSQVKITVESINKLIDKSIVFGENVNSEIILAYKL